MVCPKGWLKALVVVIWEDLSLLWRNIKKEIYNWLTRGH